MGKGGEKMTKKEIIRVWEKGYPRNIIIRGKRKTGSLRDCEKCNFKITKLQALKEGLIDEGDFDCNMYNAVCKKRSKYGKGYLLDTRKKRPCRTFQSIQQNTISEYEIIEEIKEQEKEILKEKKIDFSCEFKEGEIVNYEKIKAIIIKKVATSKGNVYKIEYEEDGIKKYCWIGQNKLGRDPGEILHVMNSQGPGEILEEEIYEKAVSTWGIEPQLWMIIEETSELQTSICKLIRDPNSLNAINVIEEAVDVEIMLKQLKIVLKAMQLGEDFIEGQYRKFTEMKCPLW